MAQPNNYMDVLEDRYGFAPANSQEEVFAAQTIAEQLQDHGLATTTEEFSAPSWGQRAYAVPALVLFLGVILLIFPSPARLVGFFLILLSGALLAAWHFGYDLLSNIGPRSQSQNIIAVRRATNVPEGERPGRTVVVVAHYDTGREDLLSRPQLASWRGRIAQLATYSVPAIGVLSLLMLIPILPDPLRIALFIIALLAAVPLLLWGINEITALTGPFTAGSVDNKTGVAAMLSVADRVVWGVPVRQQPVRAPRSDGRPSETAEPEANGFNDEQAPVEDVASAPLAIRHGANVIRDLGILPENCELIYVEPAAPAPAPVPASEPAANDAFIAQDANREEPDDAYEGDFSYHEPADQQYDEQYDEQYDDRQYDDRQYDDQAAGEYQDGYDNGYDEYDDEYDDYDEDEDEEAIDEDPEWGTTDYNPADRSSNRSMLFDLPDPSRSTADPLASENQDRDEAGEDAERVPRTKRHPMPQRRSSNESYVDDDFGAPDQVEGGHQDDAYNSQNFSVLDDDEISPVMDGTRREYKRAGGVLSHLFGGRLRRKQQEEEQSMSDWLGLDEGFDPTSDGTTMDGWDFDDDSFGPSGSSWRGGATRSSKLRFVPPVSDDNQGSDDEITEDFFDEPYDAEDNYEDASSRVDDILADEEARAAQEKEPEYDEEYDGNEEQGNEEPDDDRDDDDYDEVNDEPDRELREAITMMADEELAKHDVWFVAVGASELGRAGMANFVEKHRSDLRGAFVVNLSCVGAGNLTVVSDEGLHLHKKSDRRLVRTILRAADALHVPIQRTSVVWGDTDALPAMRKSMRAATIMGCNPDGVPAVSHTRDDIPDAVDYGMIADVVEVVCETIRQA